MSQSILSFVTRLEVRRDGFAKLSLGSAEPRQHWRRDAPSSPELS